MIKGFFQKQIAFLSILLMIFGYISSINNAYAVYDNSRYPSVSWDASSGMCGTGDIKYSPFQDNKDIEWKLDNPSCIGFVAGFGTAIVAAGLIVRAACVATNQIGVAKAAAEAAGDPIPDSPFITPNTGYKMLYRSSVLCANRGGEYGALQSAAASACAAGVIGGAALCPPAQVQAGLAGTDFAKCCAAYSAYAGAVGAGLSALAITQAIANKTFKNARICGHNWSGWERFDVNGDPVDHSDETGQWRRGPYDKSYQDCIQSIFIYNHNKCNLPNVNGIPYNEIGVKNKYFREYLYGGKEFKDNGSGACRNPTSWDTTQRESILGYADNNQRYYMKGPAAASNYACHRFLASANPNFDREATRSYECCLERATSTTCIENVDATVLGPAATNNYEHKFCKFGSRCEVGGVTFETFFSQIKSDYLCAKTYTVCPYDHNLGGGTQVEEYYLDEKGQQTGKVKNFCQVMKHCVKLPVLPYVRMSDLNGAFISSACRDLKGDSQNLYSYNAELLPLNDLRSFSAPIAQCFKETVQNMLLNKAGHTLCSDPDEVPDYLGNCDSGYHYINGQKLDKPSVFSKIQDLLRSSIKMALTLAIAFLGMMVLLGMQPIQKKQIGVFVIKIGLIMYFALGTGWQDVLIDGVLETSSTLGDIMMKIDEGLPEVKKDGCQFPRFDHRLRPDDPSRFDIRSYPPGLEYLKIWDTLDCKLIRALGFGPDMTVPNLVLTIFAGFLTGGLGIIFVVATLMFAFFFFSLILRALHIFLLSTIALVMLIYVSPITITCILFQKTKSIFDNWLKQGIGFMLQPVILFAYLGIFISIFNIVIIGDVNYRGDGLKAPKQIECSGEVNDTSVYCIFRIASFKTFTGLEPIGIGLPLITSMNKDRLNALIKAALLMFIFSQFMDQISSLAKTLVGGKELKSSTPSATEMAGVAHKYGEGVRKRGTRLAKRVGINTAKKTGRAVKGAAAIIGDKGRAVNTDPTLKDAVDGTGSEAKAVESTGSRKIDIVDNAAKTKNESADNKNKNPDESDA